MTDYDFNDPDFNRPRFLLRNRKHICVVFSSGQHHILPYERSTRLAEIFDVSCQILNLSTIERDIFGLAIIIDEFYHFLDINVKISSIHFKSIRKKTNMSLSKSISSLNISSGSLPLEDDMPLVYFRLKFYVQCNTLRERSTKHAYYQQLKCNYLAYKLLISDELVFQLGALALQAEFGPHKFMKPEQKNNYFNPSKFFPAWMVEKYGESYIRRHLPNLHQQQEYLGRAEAEFQFIRLASQSTSNFNMHLCRMIDHTTFKKSNAVLWLGVSPLGFEMFEERMTFLSHTSTLLWHQVSQFTFKKRKFIVAAQGGNALVLQGSSSTQVEHLFWLCGQMHRYQTTAQLAALQSLEAIEERDRRKFRESYVFSDSKDLELRQRSESAASSLSLQRPMKANHLHTHLPADLTETAGYSGYNSLPTRKPGGESSSTYLLNQTDPHSTAEMRRAELLAHQQVTREVTSVNSSLDDRTSRLDSSTADSDLRHTREISIDKITDSGQHSASSISIPQPLVTSSPLVTNHQLDLSTSLVLPPPHQFSSIVPDGTIISKISIHDDSSQLISPPPDFQTNANSWSVPEETEIDAISPRYFTANMAATPLHFSPDAGASGFSGSLSGHSSPGEVPTELLRHRAESPAALLSGRGMSVSLDGVNLSGGVSLDRDMSRSFPLLVSLCREFNETEILSSMCSLNNLSKMEPIDSVRQEKRPGGGHKHRAALNNTAASKSWCSETLHLDRIGDSSDTGEDAPAAAPIHGGLYFTDNALFSATSSESIADLEADDDESEPHQNGIVHDPDSSLDSSPSQSDVDLPRHQNNNVNRKGAPYLHILPTNGKNNTQAFSHA